MRVPELGACGGDAAAVPEREPPAWFGRYPHLWAVGRQGDRASDDAGHLPGAGLSVRKAAWKQVTAGGFVPMLVGRQGHTASSAEDTELCLALRLAGWRLRYDPRLRLQHFLPAERLTWDYARRVSRGWGLASASLVHYLAAGGMRGRGGRLRHSWTWWLASTAGRLMVVGLLAQGWRSEGSAMVLRLEVLRGRVRGLLAQRRVWTANGRRVREAPWRRPC